MRLCLIVRLFSVIAVSFLISHDLESQPRPHRSIDQLRREGVNPAHPEMISYERVAPLLDGLFEDVSDIQLTPLTVNSAGANSTSLDALQQSFQLSASYSYLDSIQNSANADLFRAKANYQLQLLNQISAAQSDVFAAQAKANQTQQAVNQLKKADSAEANDATKQADLDNQAAQANLTYLTGKLTTLNSQQSAVALGTPANSTSGATAAPASTGKLLGTPAFAPSAPSISAPSGTANANLPPTGQMDNQIRLLWDRSMRVLSTLGEPDSISGQQLEILRFYPSIKWIDKKTQILRLEYSISCTGGTPRVLDVYPRNSSINILSEKYKDQGWSIAGLLGFASTSLAASWNREHTQLTNYMSQNSYVTGFGAGGSTFGWMLGKALGDDTISTGQREFYALVAIPESCGANRPFTVSASRVVWQDQNGQPITESDSNSLTAETLSFEGRPSPAAPITVTTFSYAPSVGAAAVPVNIGLSDSLDAQARVVVDGVVFQQARDGFARGTAPSSSSTANNTGIFETRTGSVNTPNTWSRTENNGLTVVLDPSRYPDRFPEIVITSPKVNAINILDVIQQPPVVAGITYQCGTGTDSCRGLLPPPSKSTATLVGGTAKRWQPRTVVAATSDKIIISLEGDRATASSSSFDEQGVLVPSTPDFQPWGPNPSVTAVSFAKHKASAVPGCSANGSLLICKPWIGYDGDTWDLQVTDNQHLGDKSLSSVQALLRVDAAVNQLSKPLIISTPAPALDVGARNWIFTYPLFANQGDTVILRTLGGNEVLTSKPIGSRVGAPPNIGECDGFNKCKVTFVIPFWGIDEISDQMQLTFSSATGSGLGDTVASLLQFIAPHLSSVDSDLTLHGTNLVFDQVRFGRSGPILDLECADPDRTECRIVGVPDIKKPSFVYLYRAATPGENKAAIYYPLLLTQNGTTDYWTYKLPTREPTQPEKAVTASSAKDKSADKPVATTKPPAAKAKEPPKNASAIKE